MSTPTLILVHPDPRARRPLQRLLRDDWAVLVAETLREARAIARKQKPDVVLLATVLDDGGFDNISQASDLCSVVVVIAERPGVDDAMRAMRLGAAEIVEAGAAESKVLAALDRARNQGPARKRLAEVKQEVKDRYGFEALLSQSPRMLAVFDQIRQVARTDATALILGETGTGKELVSKAIHDRSKRKDKPFVAVNCGAFAESLLESELFGHEKGSFTGAVGTREGLFEMADGGTLFLDELGETSLNVQVNLLRVLEDMTFRRVGGREPIQVDVRIVAATNVHLEEAVEDGEFRQDLYYRLNVFPIRLPPLRERREDIPLLMRHFLDEIGTTYELDAPIVSSEAVRPILDYTWPGNVRQLRAMCERWVITHSGRRLELEHLPAEMTGKRHVPTTSPFAVDATRPMKENTDRASAMVERAYLAKVLKRCQGVLGQTADEAGITRRTLYTKMKQLGLDADDYKESAE